ncbi:GNAT family N-acetyltransferase [Candidatus Woesearchaeota archaeon]|nr:GNAT family N-acetyltransferase [Candidatus Woesearchaeota archaeon]
MPFLIRKATIKDFEKLKEIKIEFYLWECKKDNKLTTDYVKKGLGSRLAKNLKQKNTAFFIAVQKGEIIGYAGGEIKNNPSYAKYKKSGHIFNLYVKPKYQGKGIGKKLINETMKWFKKNKISDLRIMVYKNNKRAHKIYNKLGFKDYVIELSKINKI